MREHLGNAVRERLEWLKKNGGVRGDVPLMSLCLENVQWSPILIPAGEESFGLTHRGFLEVPGEPPLRIYRYESGIEMLDPYDVWYWLCGRTNALPTT